MPSNLLIYIFILSVYCIVIAIIVFFQIDRLKPLTDSVFRTPFPFPFSFPFPFPFSFPFPFPDSGFRYQACNRHPVFS